MATKAELQEKLDAYREECNRLNAKLEAKAENDNICDAVFDWFSDAATFVADCASTAKSFVLRS